VKHRRVADRGDAAEAGLALLPQPLERRDDLAQHGRGSKAAVAAVFSDMIVQLEQVDVLELQALQARLQRGRHRRAEAAALAVGYAHLGADKDVGLQALHDMPEIAFGLAISVHRCGIEIIDAEVDGTRDRPLLIGRVAAHHQPANRAAAKPEDRHRESGAAECACLHRFLRC
jgi:hypothetical protein